MTDYSVIPGLDWRIQSQGTPISFGAKTDGVTLTSTNGVLSATGAVRVVTAAGDITCSASDRYVIVNKGTGAATGVTLPASPTVGQLITVKDGKADAGTNNITVSPASGTIDGAATNVISTNSGVRNYLFDGTEWNVV